MKRESAYQLILLDVIGGGALVICLLAATWLVFVRADETASVIRQRRELVSTATSDLAAFQRITLEQQARLAQARLDLDSSGTLPSRTPIERYSQEVLRLADTHGLRVTRQNPVPARHYPGLFEQRYAYELSGVTADIVRFLAAIEATSYWADISYLRLDAGAASNPHAQSARVASITVSLFSAPQVDPGQEGEG